MMVVGGTGQIQALETVVLGRDGGFRISDQHLKYLLNIISGPESVTVWLIFSGLVYRATSKSTKQSRLMEGTMICKLQRSAKFQCSWNRRSYLPPVRARQFNWLTCQYRFDIES